MTKIKILIKEAQMGFFFTKIFWGGVLIFWGLVLIINKLFGINIPIFRFILAFILIYSGFYILLRSGKQKSTVINTGVFCSEKVEVSGNNEFTIIFGSKIFDISTLASSDPIDISTVFATSQVIISKNKSYKFNVSTAFGETSLPNANDSWLGGGVFIIGDANNPNIITVTISTVFGSTKVMFSNKEEETNKEEVAEDSVSDL